MPTDDAWLKDMLSAGREAASLTTGFNYDQFAADRTLQLAVMHLIVIIGEAAAQGSDETRARFTTLPWRDNVAMRNRLVHHYFKARLDLVWDVVRDDLPVLISELEAHSPADQP